MAIVFLRMAVLLLLDVFSWHALANLSDCLCHDHDHPSISLKNICLFIIIKPLIFSNTCMGFNTQSWPWAKSIINHCFTEQTPNTRYGISSLNDVLNSISDPSQYEESGVRPLHSRTVPDILTSYTRYIKGVSCPTVQDSLQC